MLRGATRSSLEGVRVLVVDDQLDICDVVGSVLRAYGADVEAAPSAAEARRRLRGGGFHVLLSDINMPDEDGYDLLRSIRADAELGGIAAAAMTARTSARDRLAAADAGFDALIAKPFDMATLLDAVLLLTRTRHAASASP